MTLVTLFQASPNIHIMLSDLLVSSGKTAGDDAQINSPAAGIIHLKGLKLKATPVSLGQKSFLVNDYIAVGYAGHSMAGAYLFKKLRERIGENRATTAEICDILDEIAKDDFKEAQDVDILGFTISQSGNAYKSGSFMWNGAPRENRVFGDVSAIGSGTKLFVRLLNEQEPLDFRDAPPMVAAISQSLNLLAQLVIREQVDLSPIHDYFGGFYEIITPVLLENDRLVLRKFSDYFLTFWSVKVSDIGDISELSHSGLVYKPAYKNDVLYVGRYMTASTVTYGQELLKGGQSDIQLHVVGPNTRALTPDERSLTADSIMGYVPQLESSFSVHFVRIIGSSSNIEMIAFMHYKHKGITFEKEGASSSILFDQPFFQEMFDHIKSAISGSDRPGPTGPGPV